MRDRVWIALGWIAILGFVTLFICLQLSYDRRHPKGESDPILMTFTAMGRVVFFCDTLVESAAYDCKKQDLTERVCDELLRRSLTACQYEHKTSYTHAFAKLQNVTLRDNCTILEDPYFGLGSQNERVNDDALRGVYIGRKEYVVKDAADPNELSCRWAPVSTPTTTKYVSAGLFCFCTIVHVVFCCSKHARTALSAFI